MRTRRAISFLEVVVAVLLLSLIAVPVLQLFLESLRMTRATRNEIVATSLAAELGEQVDALPFAALAPHCRLGPWSLSSGEQSLEVATPVSESPRLRLHLSALPAGYERSLVLTELETDLLRADIRVGWTTNERSRREISMRRHLTRDALVAQ